jgi:5'-methylthioadenosine phosphorylase
MACVAVILGSSFDRPALGERSLAPVGVSTGYGVVTLYKVPAPAGRAAYVLFRHGVPHRHLPHQIPYRAHAEALRAVGCQALLITSSVGVLDREVPLFAPLLVSDLFMPDNRLPDGGACSMWPEETPGQGHLVLGEGLFSAELGAQLRRLAGSPLPPVVFAYIGGPRTKTAAENRWLATTGAQVNSMTVGPEAVLAAELEIPVAGVVVGHKYSVPGGPSLPQGELKASLEGARVGLERLALGFLDHGMPPAPGNQIYRFG